jgi:7-cyano-7-deazaguanine synthase
VTLAEAMRQVDEVAALHLSYGQRTQERERRAFEAVCDHYGVERRLRAALPALTEVGGSALTDPSLVVPTDEPSPGVPITYVPFRNAQILALACSWAEAWGAEAVYLGAVEEDSSGYPDCRESFFAAFQRAVDEGTRPETKIQLRTPLLHLRKSQIVRRGLELEAPLHLSWSCYTEAERACGVCESCRLRRRGFEQAGVEDPIPYARS